MCTRSGSIGRYFGVSFWKFSAYCLYSLSNVGVRPAAAVKIGAQLMRREQTCAIDFQKSGAVLGRTSACLCVFIFTYFRNMNIVIKHVTYLAANVNG